MKIKKIEAKLIKDSRNDDTIQVIVNKKYMAAAPNGKSVSSKAIKAWPDKGVKYSVDYLNNFKAFKDFEFNEFEDLSLVEELLPIIGGNSMIALEFALLKAMSDDGVWKFLNPYADKMPRILGNCIGGGAHSKGRKPDIQEYLVIPRTKKIFNADFANSYIHRLIGNDFSRKNDEGAWVPSMDTVKVFSYLRNIIDNVEEEVGFKIDLGLDVAGSQLWYNGKYTYKNPFMRLNRDRQIQFINDLIGKYDITYVEDPLHEEDYSGFEKIKCKLVCGDDLIASNVNILRKVKGVNCVIVKPNQIGSLIKVKELIDYCKSKDIKCVMSHRSGETMDTTISHLAVGFEVPFIKCGISGVERKAKIKELINIEKEIGKEI